MVTHACFWLGKTMTRQHHGARARTAIQPIMKMTALCNSELDGGDCAAESRAMSHELEEWRESKQDDCTSARARDVARAVRLHLRAIDPSACVV